MKKWFLLFVLFVSVSTPAFADGAIGTVTRLFNSETVSATGSTVVSSVIPVKSSGYFGLWLQANSNHPSATPNLKVEYDMSYSGVAGTFATPTTANPIISALTAETAQTVSISPVPMAYMRVKVTGNATNATDTTVTAYLFRQEG